MTREAIRDGAQYAYDVIKRICIDVGPGIPCSPQEIIISLIVSGLKALRT